MLCYAALQGMVTRGTILVVDDEVDILEMIEVGLAAEGYTLVLAQSGAEAIALFDAQPTDLVISDVKMPGLDGVATISHLRQIDADVPAIVLTGYLSPQTIEECNQLGGIQMIRKPFAFRDLSNLVAVTIERVRGSMSRARQSSA